jgi:V/A-type H+-transporting ATPase subunit D
VPPGRAGRLWLAHRLGVAARAADLLDHKVRVLRQEAERFELRVERTGEAWTRTCREAEAWSLRAALVGGQAALRAAMDGGSATVIVPVETTMGVVHPGEALCRLPPPPETSGSGPAAAAATRAHRQALVAAVEHAAALAAARAVQDELSATRQRLRAVTERWTPRLEDALAATLLGLEETERAEGVSLRWALRSMGRGDGRP